VLLHFLRIRQVLNNKCFFFAFYEKINSQAPTDKISNTKHQITNKSQITIFNDQNIELKRSFFKIIFVFVILNFGSAFGG